MAQPQQTTHGNLTMKIKLFLFALLLLPLALFAQDTN